MASAYALIADVIKKLALCSDLELHAEVRNRQFSLLSAAPDAGEFHRVGHMAFGSLGELYVEVADVDKTQTPQYAARYRFQSSRGYITIWLATSNDALWLTDLFDDFAQTMYSAVPRELL